jgi:hypothetical protein
MPIEVVTAVLVGLLAVATVLAAYVGILGLARAITLARCKTCGHLEIRSGDATEYCAHADRHGARAIAGHAVHLPHVLLHRTH